jgi:hypothetical protein
MADILNNLNSANYVTVKVTDNAVINGNNLIATYVNAKAKTPNGSSLSASNRLAIILPPAIYDLGTQSLTLDTQYIDIIGSTNERDKHHIKSNVATTSSGVIRQTANNVKIINLKIENIGYGGFNFDNTAPAAYFPNANLNNTYIENVKFISYCLSGNIRTLTMRLNVEYSGTFIDCKAEDYYIISGITFDGFCSFGGVYSSGGVASGTFKNCIGGDYSFGANGNASGTFVNCTGGMGAFGGEFGGANGKFENCEGGDFSFGGNTADGTFINCKGGDYSFSAFGTRNGTFINCRGGTSSFGIT